MVNAAFLPLKEALQFEGWNEIITLLIFSVSDYFYL
jgi:hypothetical protein